MAAQIPQYRRRVGPDVAQAPRALGQSVDASGLAQGLSSVSNAITQISLKEKQEADQTALIDFSTKVDQLRNDLMYADSTPFGHSAHADPDTCSTLIRTGSRSAATQGWHC